MQTFLTRGKVHIALAPMANISDSPYRVLCRRHGASFSFSEFISTDALSRRIPSALDLLRFKEEERPIVFQIFGNDPDKLLESALYIQELKPDGIDINMGCSVKHVAHKGSGAGMLRDPVKTGKIFESLATKLSVPLSAKIRLGWDFKTLNYMEIAHILQESGAAFLSVHGRTKMQGYTGESDWLPIAQIRSTLNIPVLGNGDVQSYEDALEKIKTYNLDGVLIGRCAIGNPFIFSNGNNNKTSQLCKVIQIKQMLLHLDMMIKHYGDRALVLFRKHASRYLKNMEVGLSIKTSLLTTSNIATFKRISLDLMDNKHQAPLDDLSTAKNYASN